MSQPAETPAFSQFPIQLKRVDVGEISYTCGGFSSPTVEPFSLFELETGRSPFIPETKTIQVSVAFVAKPDATIKGAVASYSLRVRVTGEFQVISSGFPMEKIERWAELNGASVLLPFLRQTIQSVTLKSGFKPFILPMMEVKLYKVEPPARAVPAPVAST